MPGLPPAALCCPCAQDHVALFGLQLDDEDRAQIGEVLARGKPPKGDCYAWERGMGAF